ncbi:MAG: hypothetical protein QOG21_707, partial [Actinomycetota bacterium]|nr:hypothetical protein [Actinomycetota bacterium]
MPQARGEAVVAGLLQIHSQRNVWNCHFGPRKIEVHLKRYHDITVSAPGIWRILKRLDMNRLQRRSATNQRSAEFLSEPDEKAFRPPDVAEPNRVFVLDHFAADELRAVLTEPGKRLIDVVHGEHDAQVAESVHRGVPVIGDHRRREKARELEPAMAVRRA